MSGYCIQYSRTFNLQNELIQTVLITEYAVTCHWSSLHCYILLLQINTSLASSRFVNFDFFSGFFFISKYSILQKHDNFYKTIEVKHFIYYSERRWPNSNSIFKAPNLHLKTYSRRTKHKAENYNHKPET